MDLLKYLDQQPGTENGTPRMSKEEYAAMKQQEREEVWAQIDATAQDVFKDEASLKSFLDFAAQVTPQKTANLLLLYSQNPEIRQVKTYEKIREENHSLRPEAKGQGYLFLADTRYEKDGVEKQGYEIRRAYDISQIRMKQPEPMEPQTMDTLMGALLTNNPTRIQVEDHLPEGIQVQYIPKYRTVFARNGMSENVTFHAINRGLACAALDQHNGAYQQREAVPKALCAAYVVARKYGVEVSGFPLQKVCELQHYGDRDPKELRGFIHDLKNAAYSIEKHIDHNLGEPEQEFAVGDFSISDDKPEKTSKTKKQPER